jgi:L-2-hydroxyglutarate oxidase
MKTTDFLIIGTGIVGLTVARELAVRYPDSKITICDKEPSPARHGTGRNSGVLHAGFYYTADSLKAKLTLSGNKLMTEYCLARGLPIKRNGKLVVAKHHAELEQLFELARRGQANKVPIEIIDEQVAKEIEPRAKTYQKALWSPLTSTVDPIEISNALIEDLKQVGVQFLFNNGFVKRAKNKSIVLEKDTIHAKYVINAAGLYSDNIAHKFGVALNYRILPFKGLYLYSDEPPGSLRTNIYPVPDLRNPFLGVHFTLTVNGRVKIGPTAIPALWREQYGFVEGFKLSEMSEIVARQLRLFMGSDFNFRSLALEEVKKFSRRYMIHLASQLATEINGSNYKTWGTPGIRAQLLDTDTGKLEMDFKVLKGDESIHIVNAVSPAFTCSMSFAKYICDLI